VRAGVEVQRVTVSNVASHDGQAAL
jgi:hypothetical protein